MIRLTLCTRVSSASVTRRVYVSRHRLFVGARRNFRRDRARPHKRELRGNAQDKRGISERSCLAPTLGAYRSGSAQGTTPTVLRPLFVLTSFLEFAPMGLAPVPTNENCPLKSLGRL